MILKYCSRSLLPKLEMKAFKQGGSPIISIIVPLNMVVRATKHGPKKKRKPLARKSKFHAQDNKTKIYKARHTPQQVLAYAERCRQLRIESPTEAETSMQCILGAIERTWACKFEREKIFFYANGTKFIIIDFVITGKNARPLAIELDGNSHNSQLRYDKGRDKYLESQGFRTIRFDNRTILKTPEIVAAKVMEFLGSNSK